MEWILGLIGDEKISLIVMVVVCLNIAITAIHAILMKIKDVTESAWDNKAAEFLAKILGWMGKIMDILGANKEHK